MLDRLSDVPKKTPCGEVTPVSRFASQFLYCSKLMKRMAILGTIPATTAPRPLYRPRGLSRRMMCIPVAKKPRGFSPCARPRRESCMRTLMVSSADG